MTTPYEYLMQRYKEEREDIHNSRISESPDWWEPANWNLEWAEADNRSKVEILMLVQGARMGREIFTPHLPPGGLHTFIEECLLLPYHNRSDFPPEWRK